MGAIKSAIGDGIITFMWVLSASTLRPITSVIGTSFGVEGLIFNLFITVSLVSVMLFSFNFIAEALGGACYNPTLFAAFSAAGIHKESLFSVSLRLPAQVYISLSLCFPILNMGLSLLISICLPRS